MERDGFQKFEEEEAGLEEGICPELLVLLVVKSFFMLEVKDSDRFLDLYG